jgi:hypothetical protein
MMALLATTPAEGEVFSVLRDEDRFAPPFTSGSHYLEKCEEKPEVLFRLRKKIPLTRPKKVCDPYFMKFCEEFPDLVNSEWSETQMTWSDFSDEAFKIAIAKYCRKMPDVEWNRRWQVAESWLHREFLPRVAGARVLTPTETLKRMNLDTAPGPEMKFWFPTKFDFVNSIDGRRLMIDYLTALFTIVGGSLTLAGAHLKDELRPKHKVESHSTRIFICMGVLHTIGSHMLCMDFNEKMNKSASHDFPSCVGMSMFGGSFHRIAKHLLSFPHRLCTDIGKWDASVFVRLLVACCWLRWCAYAPQFQTEETWIALINTYIQIINTAVMLPDGTVVLIGHQPSGQGNTAHDNTLINHLMQSFLWLDNGGPEDFNLFRANVKPYLFGDDSIVGLTEYAYKFMNPQNVLASYKKIGWECEFAPAMEFLGHYFLLDDRLDQFVPVFPSYRALGSLSRGGDSFDQNALVSKAMSIRLLSFTNKEFFPFVDRYCHWLVQRLDPDGRLGYKSQLHSIHVLLELHRSKRISVRGGFVPQRLRCIKFKRKQSLNNRNFALECEKELKMPPPTAAKTARKKKKQKKKKSQKKASQVQMVVRGTENQSLPALSSLNNQSSRLVAKAGSAGPVPAYVACLLDPANKPSVRIPDTNYGRHTALVASKKVLQLNVNLDDNTVNRGRFSCAIQPTLGNISSPPFYKVAIVNDVPNWPDSAQFIDPDSYLNSGNGLDPDPRIDDNFFQLTGPEPALLYAEQAGAGGGVTATSGPLGEDLNADDFGGPTYNLPGRFLTGPNGQSNLNLPPGTYLINLTVSETAVAFANNFTISATGGCTFFVLRNAVIATSAVTGSVITAIVIATFPNNQNVFQQAELAFAFRAPDQWTSPSTTSFYTVTPCAFEATGAPGVQLFLDSGPVSQYRPVAMSVLATCVRPTLSDGGNIAANWIPGSSINQNYFTSNANQNVGPLQFWEYLAKTPGSYDGELRKGAYVWWSQEDRDDFNFYPPSIADDHDYPSLVVSGVLQPGADGGTGSQPVLRLEITTVYEIETLTTLFPTSSQPGSQATLDAVSTVLLGESHACQNNRHVAEIRRIIAKMADFGRNAVGWYGANKGWINPAIETIGGLLG